MSTIIYRKPRELAVRQAFRPRLLGLPQSGPAAGASNNVTALRSGLAFNDMRKIDMRSVRELIAENDALRHIAIQLALEIRGLRIDR